jgi:flagellar motor switch protein FliM
MKMFDRSGPVQVLENLKRAKLELKAVLVTEQVTIGKLASLNPGTVLMFNHRMDGQAAVTVNGQKIASGDVVKVKERFGVKIKQIHTSFDDSEKDEPIMSSEIPSESTAKSTAKK